MVVLICLRGKVIGIGAFFAEDAQPDDVFVTRIAASGQVLQQCDELVPIRVADNSLLQTDEMANAVARDHHVGRALIEGGLANLLRPALPNITARFLAEIQGAHKTPLTRQALGRELGWKVPNDGPVLFRLLRLLARGL